MRKLYVALLATAGLLFGNVAGAVTLDFEGFSHGDIVSGLTLAGVTILADNPQRSFDLAVAFDSTLSGTRDTDLQAQSPAWLRGNLSERELGFDPMLGILLIVQENDIGCEMNGSEMAFGTDNGFGTCSAPDDQDGNGSLEFIFDVPILSFGFDLIDIARGAADGTVTLNSGSDSVTFEFRDRIDFLLFGNNSANRIDPITAEELGFDAIDSVTIAFQDSGAVDNITFAPVPEPTTLAMLALGLLGLTATGSRRSR